MNDAKPMRIDQKQLDDLESQHDLGVEGVDWDHGPGELNDPTSPLSELLAREEVQNVIEREIIDSLDESGN